MELDFCLTYESVVRGHHIYKHIWTPLLGEVLSLLVEEENEYDRYAIAVMKEDSIVGHVPQSLSKIFHFFIRHDGIITCEITGQRKKGHGLEVPCCYKLTGKPKYIARAKELLKKLK